MSIWKNNSTVEQLNAFNQNTLVSHLNIVVTDISNDAITATMPVNDQTRQPMGFLHGGASVVLAETLGSLAAHLASKDDEICFGVEVNANHLRAVKEGLVTAIAQPLKIGRTMHVWDIHISNEGGDLICTSRLTVAIKKK